MKIFAKEINGKVWGLFLNFESAKQKDLDQFGLNYFNEVFPKSGIALNSYKTNGIDWNEKGHYRYENIWRVLAFRFKGFGFYKSIIFKIAYETSKPSYLN